MPYDYPKYPDNIFTDTDFPDQEDDATWVKAWLTNALKEELQACLTELGTNPKGEYDSVKARLDAITFFLRIELDYMEYANDAAAQAAYISSDGYIDRIPTMTSNTTPSGVASADCELNPSYAAWKAMNDDITGENYWHASDTALPHWLQYQFTSGKIVRRYTVTPRVNFGAADPKDWILQGSNNGDDWDTLDTQTNQVWSSQTTKAYSFANSTSYTYYRLYVTANTGDRWTQIADWELMDTNLQCYSEATIKQQGNYSLKGIAVVTNSLGDTLTRTVSPVINLYNIEKIKLYLYASRTGSNIKIGIRNSNEVITEITPNITDANTWQKVEWDISGVANINKNAIDRIIITIVNADSENTFYIDDMYGAIS